LHKLQRQCHIVTKTTAAQAGQLTSRFRYRLAKRARSIRKVRHFKNPGRAVPDDCFGRFDDVSQSSLTERTNIDTNPTVGDSWVFLRA
jgi:hypothetical protein